MECSKCGASVARSSARCPYCDSPVRSGRELEEQDRERLAALATNMERVLKESKNRYDGWVWITFLLITGAALALYVWLCPQVKETILPAVFAVILGLVGFITWGFIIMTFEQRAYEASYREHIIPRLQAYLEEQDYYRYDFDEVASTVLPKKATLRKYLYRAD